MVLVPVADKTRFLRLLQDLDLQEQETGGDLTLLKLPQQVLHPELFVAQIQLPPQVYLRLDQGYAHICLAGNPNLLSGTKLLPPEQLCLYPGQGRC